VDSIRQVDFDLALLEPMSATVVFLGGTDFGGQMLDTFSPSAPLWS